MKVLTSGKLIRPCCTNQKYVLKKTSGEFFIFYILFLGGVVWFGLVWFDPKLGNKEWLTATTSSEVFGEEADADANATDILCRGSANPL